MTTLRPLGRRRSRLFFSISAPIPAGQRETLGIRSPAEVWFASCWEVFTAPLCYFGARLHNVNTGENE